MHTEIIKAVLIMRIIMINFALPALLVFSSCLAWAQDNWSSDYVYYGKGGMLTYTPDEHGNVIPDFSQVGYHYGDSLIPNIPVQVEVIPMDGDDGASIQTAINEVSALAADANGFRGTVLLKAGTYQVSGQIVISSSGVVLRGEGDTEAGTIIIAEGTGDRDLIKVDNGASRSVNTATKVNIAEDYVPIGRKFVVVSNASGFKKDDNIVLYRPGTANWISDIKMDQITPSEGTTQWSPSSYSFYFERRVTRINGDTIFFRNPTVMAIETKYGEGSVYKYTFNRLEHVGIENICLKSAYTSDIDEAHSWKAIAFYSIQNGWVRNVTSWYFAYSCVSLEDEAKFITVQDCNSREPKSLIDGGRRYSFNLTGSMNLFKNCTTTEGRHDFVTGSRVTGPNVFTHCSAQNAHADIGPHHRWAMGTLYDIIETDGEINVQDRDDMGSGHGWSGANQVFWNCKGESAVCQSPWASALNYNFGFQGVKGNPARPGRPEGVWVGHNMPGIFPSSLYETQLDNRINHTSIFSAISELMQVNDSVFVMLFTLPLTTSQINKEHFIIGGTAGIQDKSFDIEMVSEYSVRFTFTGLGILPALSTILINADGLTSASGMNLEGVTTSKFVEPDKRPLVTGLDLTVNNEDGFVVASSSKPGSVYLIMFGKNPQTKIHLDSLVENNLGREAVVNQPNGSVPIYTKGLPGGTYKYYALDLEGRVSLPSTSWVTVNATGPVLGLRMEKASKLNVYQLNDKIMVNPGEMDQAFSLKIYSITGSLIYQQHNLLGNQIINLSNIKGLIIIKKTTSTEIETRKLILY